MNSFNSENDVIQALVKLYKGYGYKLYKPGCFEEYALYQENKDFLIGKNVIAFSDLSGRLMAMRPDVTLSLIKHIDVPNEKIEKYFYSEKVYRQTAGSKDFKEISQIGTEIVGKIDDVCVCEAAILMCKTLSAVSSDYVLDVSHMGFTEGLIKEFAEGQDVVSECLKKKNLYDFKKFAQKFGYDDKLVNAFEIVVSICDDPSTALNKAVDAVLNEQMNNALKSLCELCDRLKTLGYDKNVRVDFSVTNNADYYNGEVFNGYINGVSHLVLSGGRYDNLLKKFNKSGGAVGFALYLGELHRYFPKDSEEVDYLVVYDDMNKDAALKIADERLADGYTVLLSNGVTDSVKYKKVITVKRGSGLK